MSSNLGDYQRIVSWSKKLGSPKRLVAVVAVSGYAVFRMCERGGRKLMRFATAKRATSVSSGATFVVTSDGSDGGLDLCAGDRYRVLECDGNAILIERLGDTMSPYMVSEAFLRTVSDYPGQSSQ